MRSLFPSSLLKRIAEFILCLQAYCYPMLGNEYWHIELNQSLTQSLLELNFSSNDYFNLYDLSCCTSCVYIDTTFLLSYTFFQNTTKDFSLVYCNKIFQNQGYLLTSKVEYRWWLLLSIVNPDKFNFNNYKIQMIG